MTFLNEKRIFGFSTNAHFVTELSYNLISEKSVQGQFTRKYFDSYNHLDVDIQTSLKDIKFKTENPPFLREDRLQTIGNKNPRLSIKKNNKEIFWSYICLL